MAIYQKRQILFFILTLVIVYWLVKTAKIFNLTRNLGPVDISKDSKSGKNYFFVCFLSTFYPYELK